MTQIRKHVFSREHSELAELRSGPRYNYEDIKNLCDARDAYTALACKLDIHEGV